ncbi:MAG: J domain-containing protein [Cryomorphaceae bacterium]|nr:MAG: J domain-containing protein [Cryomorphaceae bacterium]
MANHYQTLGVTRGATLSQIKAAYRSKARASHPDHNPHPDAVRRFVAVKRAYEVLSHPRRRRQYDLILDGVRVRSTKSGTSRPAPSPPKDDRKYGTRHRYTHPPPTRAEQEQKYRRILAYYNLFSKQGMQLPRKEWWSRFNQVLRRWARREPGSGGLLGAMVAVVLGVYLLIRDNENPLGIFWLFMSLFFLRSAYINTVRNIARGEMRR